MKKLALISAIAISGLFYNTANAQFRVHLGIHFGPRPVYVPARVVVAQPAPVVYTSPDNYDGDDYYYLPDVDAYYSSTAQCYYYSDGGNWVSAAYLPGAYRDYDWRSARHYEVRAARPFMRNDYYRARFNGVAFNGRWNERHYDHSYANDRRYDNRSNDHYNQRFDNNRYHETASARQHFAQSNFPGRERNDRGDYRRGR